MSIGVGNVFLNQKAPAPGIAGSGTTNYLPLWTGSTALGDSYVYQTAGYVNIPVKLSLASSETYSSGNAILLGNYYTLNVPANTTFPQSVLDALVNTFNINFAGAATIPNTARNTALNAIVNTGFVQGSAISYTQSTGVRALSNIQTYFQVTNGFASIISHAANIQIKADEIYGATGITYTNRYGLLINDLNETANALLTYTNRWGIYQQGNNDTNYFQGTTLIGTNTITAGYKFQVNGNVYGIGSGADWNTSIFTFINSNSAAYMNLNGYGRLDISSNGYGLSLIPKGNFDTNTYISHGPADLLFIAYAARESLRTAYYGGVIVNEQGDPAVIFRVEGDTDANLIITDPINDRVGIGTATPSAKLQVSGRFAVTKGANVASANNLTLGSDGNVFGITGTTTINAITTTNWIAGSEITLIFAAALTVSNNTAGGASTAKMLLAGGVNFSATANDVLKLVYDGTNWLEVSRSLN